MLGAGQGCSNIHKELLLVTSIDECAKLACEDTECGMGFVAKPVDDTNLSCSCLAPGQACIHVEDAEAFLHEIAAESGCASESADACLVTLYETAEFGGWSATFQDGSYDSQELEAKGAMNDAASALSVRGVNCVAILYQNSDLTGWIATFPEGSYTADEMRSHGAVNDDASALVVRRAAGDAAPMESATSGKPDPAPARVPNNEPRPGQPEQKPKSAPKVVKPGIPSRKYESELHDDGINVECDPVHRERCTDQDIEFLKSIERSIGPYTAERHKQWRSKVKGELKGIDAKYLLVPESARPWIARRVGLLHKLMDHHDKLKHDEL